MSHSWDYDAIVIGSGPGGEGAAMGLVKQEYALPSLSATIMSAAVAPTGAPSRRKPSAMPSAVSSSLTKTPLQRPLPPSSLFFRRHPQPCRQRHQPADSYAPGILLSATTVKFCRGNAHFVDEHTLALECHDGTVETVTAEEIRYRLRVTSLPSGRCRFPPPAHL